jgi:hypothetical protein
VFFGRSSNLTTEALVLPIEERVVLAHRLWRSIDADLADAEEDNALRQSVHRDAELSAGLVTSLVHEDIMRTLRTDIGHG